MACLCLLVKSGCALMACLIWLVQRVAERAAAGLASALTEYMLILCTAQHQDWLLYQIVTN